MAREAEKLDAEFVTLLFPFKEQVYRDIARKYARDGAELDASTIDAPMLAVRDFLIGEGVKVCDLASDSRSWSGCGPQLYLKAGSR